MNTATIPLRCALKDPPKHCLQTCEWFGACTNIWICDGRVEILYPGYEKLQSREPDLLWPTPEQLASVDALTLPYRMAQKLLG